MNQYLFDGGLPLEVILDERHAILETILRFYFDATSRDDVDVAQTWVLEGRRLLAGGPCGRPFTTRVEHVYS